MTHKINHYNYYKQPPTIHISSSGWHTCLSCPWTQQGDDTALPNHLHKSQLIVLASAFISHWFMWWCAHRTGRSLNQLLERLLTLFSPAANEDTKSSMFLEYGQVNIRETKCAICTPQGFSQNKILPHRGGSSPLQHNATAHLRYFTRWKLPGNTDELPYSFSQRMI